eukprot:7529190-Alexandrium_andersonii.AAC.1
MHARAQAHTQTHTRTRTQTHLRTQTHMHTHIPMRTQARARTLMMPSLEHARSVPRALASTPLVKGRAEAAGLVVP